MSVTRISLAESYNQVLLSLAKENRNAAATLLKQIIPTLDKNDRFLYRDGTIGSNIVDLLRYYFNETDAKPSDFEKFTQRLTESKNRWIHLNQSLTVTQEMSQS